ncbi:MAG: hypothetical protein ACK48N_05475, partial [Planctomyces sp.]
AISTPTATGTFGPPDIYVSKTNFAGLLQWDRIIGGQGHDRTDGQHRHQAGTSVRTRAGRVGGTGEVILSIHRESPFRG